MTIFKGQFGRTPLIRISPVCLPLLLFLLVLASPSNAEDLSIEYEVIARTNSTPVPDSSEVFLGFGEAPAIDANGNVVFIGGGFSIGGVYTAIGGCCQKVADTNTLIPGSGSATFANFYGSELPDIDGGRVAFKALNDEYLMGLYSNVGQPGVDDLVEITVIDGDSWVEGGGPWVDGNTVSMYGKRPQFVQPQFEILRWNGINQSVGYVNPGAGYILAYNSQASVSGSAAILSRYKTGSYQIGISNSGGFEALATADVTPMPGLGGATFSTFYDYPVVDNGGEDVLFLGAGGQDQGLFKRVNGGVLTNVADTTTTIPGAGSEVFGIIAESGISLANGKAVFYGAGQYFLRGIYTDIGGNLSVLLDNEGNNTILLDGQLEQVTSFSLSTRSFAHTPQGYMVVFRAYLASGGSALIRATVNDGSSGGTDSFTVYKDFTNNSAVGVRVDLTCTSGTVTNNPQYASEASPAVFTISGASAGTTCTAVESVPSGYTANQTDCQNGDPVNSSCTIVNTPVPSSNTFTVYKDFSDNNQSNVTITLSCTSGSVTNNPQLASEGSPAVFNISGASPGSTCTAIESVPSGYSADQTDCQNGDPLNGSCTIVNEPVQGTNASFWVFKDFSDDNPASVSVTVSCTSGTVTNNPQLVSEANIAKFNIVGAHPDATCSATEFPVPAGYVKDERRCQNGDPLNGACLIINTRVSGSDSFTVHKNFTDNNSSSVSINLSCTSGTVTNNPQFASESSPAVFSIDGAAPGATCTAVESVPSGYSANQSDCQNGDPINGSCTIVNTPLPSTDSFTVYKDFSDNNASSVSITLNCTSGTVTNNPRFASESSPAVFNISGASQNATCTAVESVPAGYSANQSDCQNGDPINGSCTIVNTPQPSTDSFTVYKDFSDNNASSVSITLNCTSGTVTNNPRFASESSPAVFNISGASQNATCTAIESVPSGYTANQSDCQNGDPINGFCTIINTPNTVSELDIVVDGFEDGNANGWSLSGTTAIDGILAIGQYSLRHGKEASSELSVSTTGYHDVNVQMSLAGTSFKKNDQCTAEVSTNGGSSWTSIVSVDSRSDNGSFVSGSSSSSGLDNNSNLKLRFRYVGKGNGGYCYGDQVVIRGKPN